MKQSKPTTPKATGVPVTARAVSAYYGSHQAVDSVSLEFPANQITAIIGPSGCGKSTLVRCLNRMHEETPQARTTGAVLLDDFNIYDTSVDPVAVRRTVGMVFQKPNPFPTMSILENVTAGPRLAGGANGDVRRRAEQALRDAGLWEEVKDRLQAPATSLSGGQQQRLCIARMIAVEPEVLLLDEPCSALDPRSTQRVEELIVRLKKRFTVVLVTHNLQQALRVADQTVFMLDGKVVEAGATKQLFKAARDTRTREYISGKFG